MAEYIKASWQRAERDASLLMQQSLGMKTCQGVHVALLIQSIATEQPLIREPAHRKARKTWSEGISAASCLHLQRLPVSRCFRMWYGFLPGSQDKMKEGQKAAEQRHLAQLHDKSDSL